MACDGQVSSGGVCDIGLHVVWCAKYRWHVLTGLVAARLQELIGTRAAGHGWRVHKTARAWVQTCDVIALEDLRIRSMTRSASGTPGAPGTNVAAKSGLNRSILDAGWGQFADILAGKAEEAGRRIVFVDPRNTSITCHQCGQRCLRPCQALVICPVHGGMDADVNGAKNIYTRAGLGSGQAATAA